MGGGANLSTTIVMPISTIDTGRNRYDISAVDAKAKGALSQKILDPIQLGVLDQTSWDSLLDAPAINHQGLD